MVDMSKLLRGLTRPLGWIFVDSPISRIGAGLATLIGLSYGLLLARGRYEQRDSLIVCRLPSWAYPRGGMTVGRVFLTGKISSAPIYRHEAVHVDQWRRYGLLFPVLYWAAGRDPRRNRFEVEAGLTDGGYAACDL